MRAQMKMGETIIVLIIFFFLLVFGIIFYAKIQGRVNAEKSGESFELRAIQIVQRVETLPEIQCTVEGTDQYDCIDLYKLQAFANVSGQNRELYRKMMPNTKITAIASYPVEGSWLLLDGVSGGQENVVMTLPVALLDPTTRQHYFGMLIVEVHG